MTICERIGHACCCQPDEGVPCPYAAEHAVRDWGNQWRDACLTAQRELADARGGVTRQGGDGEAAPSPKAIAPGPEGARPSEAEIRCNEDGTLDEVVGTGEFHLEQMDTGHWWMWLGGVRVNLQARGQITASFERETKQGDTNG